MMYEGDEEYPVEVGDLIIIPIVSTTQNER